VNAERFDTTAARAEMARIDEDWLLSRPRASYDAAVALLDRALAAIDAGWPEPFAITDAMVRGAAARMWCSGMPDRIPTGFMSIARDVRETYEDDARAVLEYAATFGATPPTAPAVAPPVDPREERLARYRCAMLAAVVGTGSTTYGQTAQEIEARAREQLDIADRYDESAAAEKAGEIPAWERLKMAGSRIEALSAGLDEALSGWAACKPDDVQRGIIAHLRALLPAKGPTDAR
jgi:hypothetical protein